MLKDKKLEAAYQGTENILKNYLRVLLKAKNITYLETDDLLYLAGNAQIAYRLNDKIIQSIVSFKIHKNADNTHKALTAAVRLKEIIDEKDIAL